MLFRATILAFAGLASACVQQPTGALGGNPIGQPTLNQIVPAGKPFTITWNPTTPGTVSIVLLRGPSENVIPIDCLAESIPNSGTFSWTPSTSLQADVTHYGLQIVVTGTGQFQYSTQFGISNAAGPSSASSSAAASITSKAASTAASSSASATTGVPVTQISDGQVQVPTSSASISSYISISTRAANATTTAPASSTYSSSSAHLTTSSSSTRAPSVTVASSGGLRNTTIILPTGPVTVPSSLRTSATANATSASPVVTPAPLSANPNAANKAFAAGSMLSLVGMVVVLLI